jgi:hypothetical protein
MSVASRRSLALVAALSALAVAGCGRSADRDEVRAVSERFFAALAAGDGAAACVQLSPDARDKLEGDEQKPCREAITALKIEGGAIGAVGVYITNATVELAGGERAFLSQTPDGWRLTAAGCTPAQGDPAEQPFDCELEA